MLYQVGAGAVGSYLGAALAKAGNSLTVWDGDTVEKKNVHNQAFIPAQIGENKALALASMYPSIHPYEKFWTVTDTEIDEAEFIIMSADSMKVRRELAMAFYNKMCFDVRLIESCYTIYADLGQNLLETMDYKDDDPDIVGKTPPCHMPSCRADLVLVAVAHQFRNIQHYLNTEEVAFNYSIGNVDKGFHHEEVYDV